jgi:uncharacterized membrane protein
MTLNELQCKLIEAARKTPPSDAAPYAFEKRVMARITALPRADMWTRLAKPFWVAAGSCAALTLACGIWVSAGSAQRDAESFSRQFETAVYASVSQPVEDTW